MKKLIIVGAGGFGIEAYYLAKSINKKSPTWDILGFLSDVPDVLSGHKIDVPIIGTIQDWEPSDDEYFVIAISSSNAKERLYNHLKSKGAKFAVLIAPTALVCPTAEIGEGTVITGYSTVGDEASIGKCVHIAGSMVGAHAEIGDFSTTTGFANITNAKLGKRVFVGSHAVILNNISVGDDAFVCAGSIVFSKVKPGKKVFGNPAKIFKL